LLAIDRTFAKVDSVLRETCGDRFTGAVVRIEAGGQLRYERAYGTTRADAGAQPVYADTLFDLASLTKLFIATAALSAVGQGGLDLDTPLMRFFPEWRGTAQEPITLRMLLALTSGMNSGADYRELLGGNVVEFALNRALVAAPGARVIYSDLGFIARGEALQRQSGSSLPVLLRRLFGATPVFRPGPSLRSRIPATEDDGWRGRVQGEVHDEKAYLMGGSAGHAGLFGSAADIARLAEIYLACGNRRPQRDGVLGCDLALAAIEEQAGDPVLRRGLGWALKTSDENSCGRYFTMQSFGHTGFVGTCIWADPKRDCSGVLLTNSVYFGRNDTRDLRAAFYEALIEDLDFA